MMKAMILAAGKGTRMGALTHKTPKPLLRVHDKPLISYHLSRLAKLGVTTCVINISAHAEQFHDVLGDGSAFGLSLHYSFEPDPLETAGGIIQALPLLKEAPFLVISGDLWTDFPFETLRLRDDVKAHVVLVPNPDHHPQGDFYLDERGFLTTSGKQRLTYGNIGLYHPDLFKEFPPGKRPLSEVLYKAMAEKCITGEAYHGIWRNVDTPERLRLASLDIK